MILDGKKVRDFLADKIQKEIKRLNIKPKLVIIQVGDDERSSVYVKQKKIFGEKIGFDIEYIQLDKTIKEADLISRIESFNNDKSINGIIIQLPLPKKIDVVKIIDQKIYDQFLMVMRKDLYRQQLRG
ncbi:MAG: hypothetical protein NTU76_00290 [Candidatus Taylorbacteria bacterium]|nr:hypothetical protein [Candidatus Taylorbacteria bacterium]